MWKDQSPHMEEWCGGTAQTLQHWSCCSICKTAWHTLSGLHPITESAAINRASVNMHTSVSGTEFLETEPLGCLAEKTWFCVMGHTTGLELVFYVLTVPYYLSWQYSLCNKCGRSTLKISDRGLSSSVWMLHLDFFSCQSTACKILFCRNQTILWFLSLNSWKPNVQLNSRLRVGKWIKATASKSICM